MANAAFLRYSNRTVTKRAGGRYDLTDVWQVSGIQSTRGGRSTPDHSWQSEALNATELPKIGDINQNGGYVCISVTPRSLDDQGTANVEVRYQEDPLTLPSEVHYFTASKVKPAWRGVAFDVSSGPGVVPPDGTAGIDWDAGAGDMNIRNSASDRFNPPVTYEMPLERIEISFHCSLTLHDSYSWEKYLKHWNKTDFQVIQADPDNEDNNSTRTFLAGTVMFMDKRAPLIKEPYFHRLVTCVFLHDPDMWGVRLPDMGPRCLRHMGPDGSGGVKQIPWTTDGFGRGTVTDALGRPFSGPAELDGTGGQLIPGADGKMPPAVIYQWWPIDDNDKVLSAEFDDLELFTPERALNV